MEATKLTEEQQKDAVQRIESFRKEYQALVEKYQVDFMSFPQYAQTPQGFFITTVGTQLIDKKYMPVASPLSPIIK